MNESSPLWRQIAPSEYPWERDALDFVRRGLPDHEPHRAWANFEFLSEDGSIHEVDVLVLTPKGLFLVEIKSWSGTLEGDASTWVVHQDGRVQTHDSPLFLANSKARRLASLLRRQRAVRNAHNLRLPYIEPVVFLSNRGLRIKLSGTARQGVHGPDEIHDALLKFEPSDLVRTGKTRLDRPTAKVVERAITEAGIRPTQRVRRAGDYVLDSQLESGPDYQDWQAHHSSYESLRCRIRVYTSTGPGGSEARARLERAARREIEALKDVFHPGLLKPLNITQHDLGPALVFEHDPGALRLDHFLASKGRSLGLAERLALVRQVAETLRYIHEKHLYHRALSPRSILVFEPDSPNPRPRLLNWQTAAHGTLSSGSGQLGVTGTSHLDPFVEDEARLYLAPEALTVPTANPVWLDIFSLGALAFFIVSGRPPASSLETLHESLRAGQGLQLASAMDGASEDLSVLIQLATRPDPKERWLSVGDFLDELAEIEKKLPRAGEEYVSDPVEAQTGDRFREGFEILRRLGRGSTSIVFLVGRGEEQHVLKLAAEEKDDEAIRTEGETLRRLKHPRIIQLQETVTVAGRAGLLLPHASEGTVAQKLRKEGRFQAELLQRYGEDLLQAVAYLESEGVPHRDIKPDNLGILKAGRNTELHLVLFDFSLSSAPAERIFAGTRSYLDPFLRNRRTRRWDLQAERFSVGVTLYEMATGTLPRWGTGEADPGMIDDEARIESELMDSAVREPLTRFFEQALRRDPRRRFDNAAEMLAAWTSAFREADRPLSSTAGHEPPAGHARAALEAACERAHPSTSVSLLGLSNRVVNALERAEVVTVQDLLRLRPSEIKGMRGVGSKTRGELQEAIDFLARRLGRPEAAAPEPLPHSTGVALADMVSIARLDILIPSLLPARDGGERRILEAFFGISPDASASGDRWPSQSAVAETLGLTRARISQVLVKARGRWQRNVSIGSLRDILAESLQARGGVAAAPELAEALLSTRGSAAEEPLRTAFAYAALRAATEAEEDRETPRWTTRRTQGQLLFALAETEGEILLDTLEALGRKADDLARQDPLPSPQRVLEELQDLFRLVSLPLSADRLLSLATGASRTAALSSRLEIYPVGLTPERALRLASGSLLGARELTVEEIHNRVASRFPQAQPLPGHPRLGDLLEEAGIQLRWDASAAKGKGAFVPPPQPLGTTLSASRTFRQSTLPPTPEPTDEEIEARLFEERLDRAAREGTFLALAVDRRRMVEAEEKLSRRFPVERISLEERWLDALQRLAHQYEMDWSFVLDVDARPPEHPETTTLRRFAAEALRQVEDELRRTPRPVLLTRPGLLAHFGQMDLLVRLQDRLSRHGRAEQDGPPGLWVLVPMEGSNPRAEIDGEAVAIVPPATRLRVPDDWIDRGIGGIGGIGSIGGIARQAGKETP